MESILSGNVRVEIEGGHMISIFSDGKSKCSTPPPVVINERSLGVCVFFFQRQTVSMKTVHCSALADFQYFNKRDCMKTDMTVMMT